MGMFDFFKKKKKDSEVFEEMDIDLDSDHPVHEKFVDEKDLRKIKKKESKK